MSSQPLDTDLLTRITVDLLEAHVRGNGALTSTMGSVLESVACDASCPATAGAAWRVLGLVAPDPAFFDCFRRAVELHSSPPCSAEAGTTLLAFGERLRRAGYRQAAREQLLAAREIFAALQPCTGHDAAVNRIERELLATTGPGSRRFDRARTAGLTAQEFAVAQAAATGATNRQVAEQLFLSTKTVEFHLGNVYRKLGVRRRTELVHRLVRAGLVPLIQQPAKPRDLPEAAPSPSVVS